MTLTEIRREFADYYFDRKAARRVVRFFETELSHIKGSTAGQKFLLERWQKRILRRFYGWKSRKTGLRKYRVLYLEFPRKNGKTTIGAGIALYHLDADKEPGAEVVAAAADADQAAIVFDVSKEMVAANFKLKSRIRTYRRSMAVLETSSSFKVISSTASTKHGANLSGVIVDELHAQPDRELVDVLTTSQAFRTQPVLVFLTTAGYDKNSICWEYHDYAIKVNEGIIKDPSFLGVIYAADEKDDWTSEETWRKANPNLGVTVRLDYLRDQCEKAKQVPAYENTFKRLHLNIWTEQDSRWLAIEKWDACRLDFSEQDLLGEECIAGLDLASTDDLTSLVLVFQQEDGYAILPYFWAPEDCVERRSKKDRVKYDEWVKTGLIEMTPTPTTDYDRIRKAINDLHRKFNIKEIVVDRWNANQLATQLQGDGFSVMYWGQGYASMTAPTKELNSLILSKRLRHNGNDVLRWMARNVAVEQDAAGNIKPSKAKSKEKIDGIVALVMALGRQMALCGSGRSVYEEDGLLVLG